MMDQQIVIGTPKRILHFLKKKVINLKRTSYLVLDEIDNMLETEMESYLQSVMSQIRVCFILYFTVAQYTSCMYGRCT